MVFAGEVSEVVGAEFAERRGGVARGEEGVGDLVRAGRVHQPDVLGGEHRWYRAPAGRDDRQIVGERLDQHERLAFVRIGARKTKDGGEGEERVLLSGVREPHVTNDVGAERVNLGEERVLFGNAGEMSRDGEAHAVRLAAVRDRDGSENIENAFFA